MATAKKWVYTSGGFPQCLKQTTYTPPAPSSLKPTEIQIRTKAFAINPVDVQAMNLYKNSPSLLPWPLSALTTNSWTSGGAEQQEHEHETCCDFSGTVAHAGADSGFRPGDEVFGITLAPMSGTGAAAEVLTLDTAGAAVAVAKTPETWKSTTAATAAAAVPLVWLTARVSVDAVEAWVDRQQTEDKWLVVLGGSSATGMHTVRLARARGWRVLATCSARNVALVRDRLGADEVVDRTAVGAEAEAGSLPGEILRRLEGRLGAGAADRQVVVVDCVGGTECLDDAALGPRISRYVTIVGDKRDRSSMGGPAVYASYPRMAARWLLGRVGLGVSYDCVMLEARSEWLEEAGRTLGEDDVVVDSTFRFDDLPAALGRMVEGQVTGKLVGVLD